MSKTWCVTVIGLALCGSLSAQRHRAVKPPAPPQSTEQRLEAAVTRGEISREQAITYKVFAMFSDPRFPEQYRGEDGGASVAQEDRTDLMLELARVWNTLSPAAQETLQPFRLPAFVDQSWYGMKSKSANQAASPSLAPCTITPGKWSVYDVVIDGKTKAKVWTDKVKYQPEAQAVASEIQQKWNTVRDLFGQEPLPDPGGNCYGPDSVLDVVIAEIPPDPKATPKWRYWGSAIENGCTTPTPSYIAIAPGPDAIEFPAVIHELAHTFFFSFPLKNCVDDEMNLWWLESASSYAAVKAYPNNHYYQQTATRYQQTAHRPIWEGEKDDKVGDTRIYGLYLLAEYIDRKYGRPDFVRAMTQAMSELTAIDALPGHVFKSTGLILDRFWPEFAAAVSNRPPFDYFKQWEALQSTATTVIEEAISSLSGLREFEFVRSVRPLSMRFYDFKFAGAGARSIQFWNGYGFNLSSDVAYWAGETVPGGTYKADVAPLDGRENVQVTAAVKVEGERDGKLLPWTSDTASFLCRDRRAERVEDLLVIVTSTNTSKGRDVDALGLTPRMQVSDIGCYRYKGTVTTSTTSKGGVKATTNAEATFTADIPNYAVDRVGITFKPTAGTIDWMFNQPADSSGCTTTGSANGLPVEPGPVNLLQVPNFLRSGSRYSRSYYGQAESSAPVQYVTNCPPPTGGHTDTGKIGGWWFYVPITSSACPDCPLRYVDAGGELNGSWFVVDPNDAAETIRYEWHLKPVRE